MNDMDITNVDIFDYNHKRICIYVVMGFAVSFNVNDMKQKIDKRKKNATPVKGN